MSKPQLSIEPLTHSRAKIVAELGRAAARHTHGLFRLEGWRALKSAADAGVDLEEIVVREETLNDGRLNILRRSRAKAIYRTGTKGMSRLTALLQDQGVIATARTRMDPLSDVVKGRRILALDGVQDPGNVGTLIRSAAWFGIDAVIAGSDTADFFNPKVVRATAGGIWDLALVRSNDLAADLSELKSHHFACFGADIRGDETPDWQRRDKVVLVLGSEGHGISESVRQTLDGFVHLARHHDFKRGVESLNVAAAGSILIDHWVT